MTNKNKWVRVICLALVILVPFSRMYVGVHTPADVLVAAAMAIVFLAVLHPVIYKNDGKNIPVLLAVMTLLAAAFLLFVELYPFPMDIDLHNLESGVKNAYTLLGSLVGLIIVYLVDQRYLHFDTKAVWWAQVLKVAFGLQVVLADKSGMKTP